MKSIFPTVAAGEVITAGYTDFTIIDAPVEVPAVLASGGELKTDEVSHLESVLDKAAWPAATCWFLSIARTPMYAPYGVMDGIEQTLAGLPLDIPNGYVLQGPLES